MRDLLEELDQHLEVGIELVARTTQVVGGQHPRGDCRDLEMLAPAEEFLQLGHPASITVLVVGESLGTSEAAVSVQDDADVLRKGIVVEAPLEPSLVERVERGAPAHFSSRSFALSTQRRKATDPTGAAG